MEEWHVWEPPSTRLTLEIVCAHLFDRGLFEPVEVGKTRSDQTKPNL